jgi:putative transposase
MPKDRKPNQTWMTFLSNHVGQLVSIDFFTVATIRLRVLYVFVVLAHDRRRVIHFNVTEHPTAVWAAQQIIEAFPDDNSTPVYGRACFEFCVSAGSPRMEDQWH